MTYTEQSPKRTYQRVWRFVVNGVPVPIKAFVKRLAGVVPSQSNKADVLQTQPDALADEIVRECRALRLRGNLAKAKRRIQQALKSYPDTKGLAIEYAEIATAEKNQSEAISRWRKIINEYGDRAPSRAWLVLARLLRRTEEFDDANAVLQQGMSLHSKNLALFEKEALRLANDARWPPPTMNGWCAGARGAARIASPRGSGRFSFSTTKGTESVLTPKFRYNDHVVQACAFGGMRLCHDKAHAAIRWADACRQTWLEEEGELESSWSARDQAWKAHFIGDLLASTVARVIEKINPDRQLTMGVSSGYDSRALLYILRKIGVPLNLFTFGQIGDCDYDFVSWVSAALSLDTRCFDTSEIEWNLGTIDNYIQHTQNYPVSPLVPVTELMNQLVPWRIELHGNFGDSLTSGPPLSTVDHTWQEALPVFCKRANVFALQRLLPAAQVASFLPPEPLIDSSSLSYAKQLDIGYLDAQRVRPLDGPEVEYATPFRDARWVGFWLNRKAEELEDRALWIQFLQRLRTPEFAELNESYAANEAKAKKALVAFLYGSEDKKGIIDLSTNSKELPVGKHMHFCFSACYANNASFRRMVNVSIDRLKSRGIFQNAFVDDVIRHLDTKAVNAGRMVNGLVSLDVMAEAELLTN